MEARGTSHFRPLLLFVASPDDSILVLLAPTGTNHVVLVAIFV